MSFRSVISDFQLANAIYTGAVVSFYTVDPETGLRTTTLATLYAAPTGAKTAANPQTLDSEGKVVAPVYNEEPLIAEVVGPNVGSHTTGVISARGRWQGQYVSGTRYYVEDFITNPSAQHQVYIATQDFTASNVGGHSDAQNFDADLTAGKLELEVKGGDTFYFTIDDPGMPASGERWRTIITEECTLVAAAPGCSANGRVAATADTVFSIVKTVATVDTVIGHFTIAASGRVATFSVAANVTFPINSEIAVIAPTRDATFSDLAATIRLERNPT